MDEITSWFDEPMFAPGRDPERTATWVSTPNSTSRSKAPDRLIWPCSKVVKPPQHRSFLRTHLEGRLPYDRRSNPDPGLGAGLGVTPIGCVSVGPRAAGEFVEEWNRLPFTVELFAPGQGRVRCLAQRCQRMGLRRCVDVRVRGSSGTHRGAQPRLPHHQPRTCSRTGPRSVFTPSAPHAGQVPAHRGCRCSISRVPGHPGGAGAVGESGWFPGDLELRRGAEGVLRS